MTLTTYWTTNTPLNHHYTPTHNTTYTPALWAIALLALINTLFFIDAPTNDYHPVYTALSDFWQGKRIYDQDYASPDPHYLYTPGATFLLSPLGLFGYVWSRRIFVTVSALCLVAALGVLLRHVGVSLRSWQWPCAVIVACVTESVRSTLSFGNINAVLLLLLSVFLVSLAKNKQWVAGCVLGALILIKPQFAPLLILPIVKLQWRPVIPAVGIVGVFNAVGVAVVSGGWGDFVHKLVPYLGIVRPFANVSIPGMAAFFESDSPWWAAWKLVIVVAGFTACVILLRWRNSDVFFWLSATTAVILVSVFLLSSLGQTYYSMWVFPFIIAALYTSRRWVLNVPMAVALVLFLSPMTWGSEWMPQWASFFHATWGWSLFVVTLCGASLLAYHRTRRVG